MCSNFYKIWHLEQIEHADYMNIVLGIDGLDPKLKIQANLVPTLKFVPIFIKFGNRNKLNMLIMNIILVSV